MSQPRPTHEQAPEPRRDDGEGYETPAIAWEEDFEPAGQATGCSSIEPDCVEGSFA